MCGCARCVGPGELGMKSPGRGVVGAGWVIVVEAVRAGRRGMKGVKGMIRLRSSLHTLRARLSNDQQRESGHHRKSAVATHTLHTQVDQARSISTQQQSTQPENVPPIICMFPIRSVVRH
jgi:hypothetical protein